jgi:integrase
LAPNRITREAVIEWRNRISREGTGFVVPGAKKVSPKINGSSASLINKCIDAIRRMLDIAVERGQLPGNPLYARGLKLKNTPRKPHLPEAAKLAEVFSSIEHGRGRFSRGAADLARFLAYTGCRISEAKGVTWADVDFKRGTLYVHGTKTKASEREVPLIREARSLLERLYADRQMFASHAIDGVAIRLREGEAAVIVGRSGSGKTMFCRSLIGLLPPRVQYSGGRMFWHGTRIDLASPSHAELRGKGMVMLFQNPEKCLNPSFTIGHQLGDLARYSSSLIEES